MKKVAESQAANCPGCGRPLINLPWSVPSQEWVEDGKELVETWRRWYIRVCNNVVCRLYRTPQGSFEGPCGQRWVSQSLVGSQGKTVRKEL